MKQESSRATLSGNLLAFSEKAVDSAPQRTVARPEKQTAASTFRELRRCHVATAQIAYMRDQINACNFAAQHQDGYDDVCKRQITELNAKIQTVEDQLSHCSAIPAQVDRDYNESVAKAAGLGDADAQICYIRGIFKDPDTYSKQAIEQYKDNAFNYVGQAMARGDWRAVVLMGSTENFLAHAGGLMASLPIGDPLTVYRMNRLLRFGATGEYAELLDILKKESMAKLSQEQISQANSWAKEFYEENFAHSPVLTSAPQPCVDTP